MNERLSEKLPAAAVRRRWALWLIPLVGLLLVAAALLRSRMPAESAESLVESGGTALSQGQFENAQRDAERAVQLAPEMAPAWRLLAEAAGKNNQFERASQALDEYCRQRPGDASRTSYRLGREWMLQNQVAAASRAFMTSEREEAFAADSLRFQAQIAAVTGHPRQTVRCLMELLKRRNVTRGDLQLLTSPEPSIGDAARLEAILKANPADQRPQLAYALNALNQNQYEEAERILLVITTAHPEDVEAQGSLGELYARFLPEKFLIWHSRLPEASRDDSRVWSARGRWLQNAGHPQQAIRCLFEAIQREPELLSATSLLGQLLKSVNETELGTAFAERGQRLQRIVDYNVRLTEPRSNEFVWPLIQELKATGRLWEAWGWSSLPDQLVAKDRPAALQIRKELEPLLGSQLPRTAADAVPVADFPQERFPLPDWSTWETASPVASTVSQADPAGIHFEDRAADVGLNFQFANSYVPAEGRKIHETMGAGVAALDFDADGWTDLYLPQGNTSPTATSSGPSDCLFRNLRGQHYVNVTSPAGVREMSYSQGVAAGDFDNDGFPDLYVANLGRNSLLHNNGDGTFSDVTTEAGLKQSVWTVSCAMADLNGDGFPELFDANYVQADDLFTGFCTDSHGRRTVCRPTVYDPVTDTVAINLGDGRFLEQQQECGLDLPRGMGLGLAIADFNEDDRLDVFVANDMTANYLLINQQTRSDDPLRFQDEAILRNVALDENGLAQACMGIACADINRDSVPDLFITNFAQESNTLYLSQPGGFFQDRTQAAGLQKPSFPMLGFGTQFLDADNDGWYDLAVANGHIDEFVEQPFRMKPQFFRGLPDGRFVELFAKDVGPLFDRQGLGRGMAMLDWNRDGRIDFVTTDVEQPVTLAENQSVTQNKSLRLKLIGTRSSRDAIGAKVRIAVENRGFRYFQLTAGDGYESSNERILCIGVGLMEQLDEVQIRWPSGLMTERSHVSLNHEWLVIEGHADWISRD